MESEVLLYVVCRARVRSLVALALQNEPGLSMCCLISR